MAEYWKSTPSYWCKFCSQYVRDTAIEKKNHEASGKHQNNIQRSLRDLHKKNDREEREKQRAKAEVARVNGIVSGKKTASGSGVKIEGLRDLGGSSKAAGPQTNISAAQQRKLHAEQLAALGVELPEDLKKEVTGVGGWQVVSERVIEDEAPSERSMADVLKQEQEGESKMKGDVRLSRGVHKRKVEDEEDEEERAAAKLRRKAWGSRLKTYPGDDGDEDGEQDLDALLSGVTAKKPRNEAREEGAVEAAEPEEVSTKQEAATAAASGVDNDADAALMKEEDGADKIDAPPVVFFKKRKAKK